MDFSIIIGFIVGLGLIVYGVFDGGNLSNFISYSSMAITFGGTIAATVMSFPIGSFKHIPKHMKIIMSRNRYKPQKYIDKIVDYAIEARRKGILALEDKANNESDEFLKRAIMLIVDAIEPAKARSMLEAQLDCLDERHSRGWTIYERAATYAPAFGMIGTLIGLINMLKSLGETSSENAASALGAGMSVALITTLYGSMLANLLLVPIATKLRMRHSEEMICKELIVEGVLAIHSGTNPRQIEEGLNAYVENRLRKYEEESEVSRPTKKENSKRKSA